MNVEKAYLRHIEKVILDTAALYGIEEVFEGEMLPFPKMAGWFEGEKLGGDFLVSGKGNLPDTVSRELMVGNMAGFTASLLEILGIDKPCALLGESDPKTENFLTENGISYTKCQTNDKNNIVFIKSEDKKPLAVLSMTEDSVTLRVMVKELAIAAQEQQMELPPQKGCTLFLCTDAVGAAKALGLASQLREEGFSVVVAEDKKTADQVGAAFTAELDAQAADCARVTVVSQSSGCTDEVSIIGRGLVDYIYEQTMFQAMQDVEESLNADTSSYDFTKGFSLF